MIKSRILNQVLPGLTYGLNLNSKTDFDKIPVNPPLEKGDLRGEERRDYVAELGSSLYWFMDFLLRFSFRKACEMAQCLSWNHYCYLFHLGRSTVKEIETEREDLIDRSLCILSHV